MLVDYYSRSSRAAAAGAAALVDVDANNFISTAHHCTYVRVGINCRRDGLVPHPKKTISSDLHESCGHACRRWGGAPPPPVATLLCIRLWSYRYSTTHVCCRDLHTPGHWRKGARSSPHEMPTPNFRYPLVWLYNQLLSFQSHRATFDHKPHCPSLLSSAHTPFDVKLSGRSLGNEWRRDPGRPRSRWVYQFRRGNSIIPVNLWRQATSRGHGWATLTVAGYMITMTTSQRQCIWLPVTRECLHV